MNNNKYITYYKPDTNKYYIEKTNIKYNQWNRPIIWGGFIINKTCIFNTLKEAKRSLKNARNPIIINTI